MDVVIQIRYTTCVAFYLALLKTHFGCCMDPVRPTVGGDTLPIASETGNLRRGLAPCLLSLSEICGTPENRHVPR